MKFKTIRQTVIFGTKPSELYSAILDPEKQAEYTQAETSNNMKAGGKFTAYDNYIEGTNLELEKDKKIVQKWTCTDFPKGHYTTVVLEFKKHEKGTRLVFTQNNVPDKNFKNIAQGWKNFYWKPLKAFLKANNN